MLTQFDAFLILFFLMSAMVILICICGWIDSKLNPDPDAEEWDTKAQEQHHKGVRL